MSIISEIEKELLIVSVTPQNLKRGELWYAENLAAIKKARTANPWWRENALFLEEDLAMKPSFLVRRLMDLGYERASAARGRGLFAVHGGVVEVWPIQSDRPWLIEFAGNLIATLVRRQAPLPEIRPRRRAAWAPIADLPTGSYVVHVDHGIGIFRGVGSENSQLFIVEYAPPAPGREPDRLLVPVDQKERLSPYIGFTTPAIHRLGGSIWTTAKRKVREDAEKLARSLLALYAARHGARRPPYAMDQVFIQELAESFSYAATDGQIAAAWAQKP